MARDKRWWHHNLGRPAGAGRLALLRSLSPILIAAILAIAAVTVLAVYTLSGPSVGHKTTAPAFLKKELGLPQAHGSLVRKPAPNVTIGSHAFADPTHLGDRRLLSVAMLTFAGVNFAPAGLGWKLKGPGSSSKVKLQLGGPTFPALYANDPAIQASAAATNETTGFKKALDLSRPIRAGPGDAQAINTRVAASSNPNSRRHLDGV